MSLPTFPELPEGFTFENSVFQIITSIAMEEIGLSHIINAEGEKLQYILGTLPNVPPPSPPPTIDQVIEVNDSVREVLRSISFSHMFLNAKMTDALKAYLEYICLGGCPTGPVPTGPTGPIGPEIPGVGGSVVIDGFPWTVMREVVNQTGTYKLLVSGVAMAHNIQFNPTQDSYYGGSNLQSVITGIYSGMNVMKQIAVVPNLGNHAQYTVTEPTPQMAGAQTEDIFFALTWQDVTNWGSAAYNYPGKWWTRSAYSSSKCWYVYPAKRKMDEGYAKTKLGVVPAVWVRVN